MSRRRIMDDPIIISTQTNAPVMKVLWDKGIADREHSFSHGEAKSRVTDANVKTMWINNSDITHFNEFLYFTGITGNGLGSTTFFYNCSNLETLKLPESMVMLGNWYSYQKGLFQGTQIEYLKIPSKVATVTTDAFRGMAKLKTLVWNKVLPFSPNVGAYYGPAIFSGDTALENIVDFPTQFTVQGPTDGMFSGCASLNWSNIWPTVLQAQKVNADICRNSNVSFTTATFPNCKSYVGYHKFETSTALHEQYNIYKGSVVNLPVCETYQSGWDDDIVKYINMTSALKAVNQHGFNSNHHVHIDSTTVPTFGGGNLSTYVRVYVPESALNDYKTATNWTNLGNRIIAYKDPSTARFCSFPVNYTIPSDYIKVAYIESIVDNKNSPLWTNYTITAKTQILFDFSHEWYKNSECRFIKTNASSGIWCGLGQDFWNPEINFGNWAGSRQYSLAHWWHPGVTGEDFGARSTFKIHDQFISYHNTTYQNTPAYTDASDTGMVGFFTNSNRHWRFYELAIFDYVSGDTNDPSNYTLARHYIPVQRISDGKYGAYDYVTGHFAVPSGTNNDNYPFSGPTE